MDGEAKSIQENLQSSLKQEIGAMREMLANMHQEELSLIAHDRKAWMQVMMDRVGLLSRLSELRSARLKCAQELEHSTTFAELDCEILSMRDQLTSLIEKMNQQQHRIQNLEDHACVKVHGSSGAEGPQLDKPKSKGPIVGIATYPKDKID